MAFQSFSVPIGTADTDVIICPASSEGAVVLAINNVSGLSATYTLKLYRQASGTTVTMASAVAVPANSSAKYVVPISLTAADKIVMQASAANAIVAAGTFTFAASVPVAAGLTPRGEWSSSANYVDNDVVSLSGASYLARQDSTNQNPAAATAFWQVLAAKGDTGAAGTGSGDVTAAAAFGTDNRLLRSDGTDKGAQASGITVDDSNNVSGIVALSATTLELGHASDTTLSRSAAGVVAVEGVALLKANGNQTVTGGFAVTPFNDGTVSSGTNTPLAADGNYQYYTNNGAHTLAAPASDCAIDILVTNGASAGSITFSGFTVGSSTGSALTTTNTHRFIISIRRINSVSTYSIYALQ